MARNGQHSAEQGIVKDDKGQEQPADKQRAQTVHRTDSKPAISREAKRDPRHGDSEKTPGSRVALGSGDAPAD
jgi:hypothetical protein